MVLQLLPSAPAYILSPAGVFDATRQYRQSDGSDLALCVNRAVAAAQSAGGGIVDVPRMVGEIVFAEPIVISPNAYSNGLGITLRLNGNRIQAAHTGVAIDVQSNYFVTATSYQAGQKRTVIEGGGGLIRSTAAGAMGGVRSTDTIGTVVEGLSVYDYTTGFGVQLAVSAGSVVSGTPTRWNEFSKLSDLFISNCITGLQTACDDPLISFLGTLIEKVVVEGKLSNSTLFDFSGGLWDSKVTLSGGYINQGSTTGSRGFRLNGSYRRGVFDTCWIDGGPDASGQGAGVSDGTNNIVFGTNFTTFRPWLPRFRDPNLALPVNAQTKLLLDGPYDYAGVSGGQQSANEREVAEATAQIFVANSGSDTANHGRLSTSPFKTIGAAIAYAQSRLDGGSKGIQIKLNPGDTFAENVSVQGSMAGLGSGSLIIDGGAGATINAANGDAITLLGATLTLQNLTVTAPNGTALNLDAGTVLTINTGMRFGAAQTHFKVVGKSSVRVLADYTITANVQFHAILAGSSSFLHGGGKIDASGRTFTNFIDVAEWSIYTVGGGTYGTAGSSGTRFYAHLGGMIQLYGASKSMFPGSSDGFTDAGSFAVANGS